MDSVVKVGTIETKMRVESMSENEEKYDEIGQEM